MTSLPRHRRELLLKLFFEHGAAERAGDVEAVMATLCQSPKYELYPVNYRMEGEVAIREFYQRLFRAEIPGTSTFRIEKASGNLGDLKDPPVDVLWFANDSMVTRDDLTMVSDDGRELSMRYLSIFTLEDDLLEGEIIYMSAAAADYIKRSLGSDFVQIPGVSIID